MKCQYCNREPVRACLMCGVFYCEEHGKYLAVPGAFRKAPYVNSLCQECQEKSNVSLKNLAIVFGTLGGIFATFGFVMTISLQTFVPGGIFLIQGLVFLLITMIFGMKSLCTNGDRK